MINIVLPATQARKDFLSLVDKVDEEYTRIDVTKKGRVRATLVSSDYLEALEESLFTQEHSMRVIRKAEAEIVGGKYITLEEYQAKVNARKTNPPSAKRSKRR